MIESGLTINSSAPSVITTRGHNGRFRPDWRNCCSKKTYVDLLKKRIPIFKWLPEYKVSYILQDMIAGITVGLTAIPQGIAYAGVAGLPPQYGLYSGLMGCFVYLIFGSCKDVNIGPTAIMALMIHPHVIALGPDIAVLASFLTGCVIFILGILQLGFLVDFISYPVVAGFTSAAALTIGSSQLTGLFGIKGKSNEFLDSWLTVFRRISEAKLCDSLLSVGSIIFLVFAKWLSKHGRRTSNPEWTSRKNILGKIFWSLSISRNAIVVIFGIFLAWCFSQQGTTPFSLIGKVGKGLPPFQPPPFTTEFNNKTYTFPEMAKQLGSTIIFMPLVAILESVAITKAFSKGKSVDATQEMIALGLCNIAGSFIRSMSVTGSFTRTVLNNASGVVTTVGGVFTAFVVFLALELLTSTFYYIPKATLSAIIIVAMVYMIEIEAIILLWRTKKTELLLYFVTLLASLFLGVEYGILIGIATNIAFLLYNNARPAYKTETTNIGLRAITVFTPLQSLYFSSAEYIRQKIVTECEEVETMVIDGKYVNAIDVTVVTNINIIAESMIVKEKNIIFWNFNENVRKCIVDYNAKLDKYFFNGSLEDVIEK